MKKSKEQLIEEFLKTPIQVGENIYIRDLGSQNKVSSWRIATIQDVDGDKVAIKEYRQTKWIEPENYKRYTHHIGVNPFQPEIRSQSYQSDIEQILWRCGLDRDGSNKMERYFNVDVPECNFNPIIIDDNGDEIKYQRDYVWTLKEKQLLIESIYNNMDIGKIVLRCRSFKWVEDRINAGILENTTFKDIVDGKQRVLTMLSFIKNEFPDLHNNYYRDLSLTSQRKFLGYRNVVYVELPEDISDKDVLRTFLAINHTGVPQSEEHINFVKEIYNKTK